MTRRSPYCTAASASRSSLHHSALDVPRSLEHLDAAARLRGTDWYAVQHGPCPGRDFGVRTALMDSSSDAVLAIGERDRRRDLVVAAGWAKGWALFAARVAESAAVGETQTWQGAHDLANSYLIWSAAQAPAVRSTIYLLDARRAFLVPEGTGHAPVRGAAALARHGGRPSRSRSC